MLANAQRKNDDGLFEALVFTYDEKPACSAPPRQLTSMRIVRKAAQRQPHVSTTFQAAASATTTTTATLTAAAVSAYAAQSAAAAAVPPAATAAEATRAANIYLRKHNVRVRPGVLVGLSRCCVVR